MSSELELRPRRRLWPVAIGLLGLAAVAHAQSVDAVYFESTVLPVLKSNCFACHSDKNLTSGLSLQSREGVLHGGNRGAKLDVLLSAVRQTGDLKMPPGKQLAPAEIAAIEKWIGAGVPMPDSMLKMKRRGADHWAFQPPKKAPMPAVRDAKWARTPLDRFILARLDAANLKPSPEADRATLLRRVSLDLTGLPPSPNELAAFLADQSPDSYERAVDRLLASPHYGERWGRHWLDIARYADSDGYTIDAPRDIYLYRDWVINAINRDMPFNQFTIEQLAGDLLPNPTNDQLIATGFHRNTPSNFEGGIDFEQYRVEAVADRVITTSAAYLGLTVGCARCHDHKYDPISQREFYQLFAFFNNFDEVDKEADRKFFNKPFLELGDEKQKAAFAEWQQQVIDAEAEMRKYLEKFNGDPATDPGAKAIDRKLADLRRHKPKLPRTMIVRELPTPRPAYIHLGGDFTRHGASVTPGVPAVMQPLHAAGTPNRLDLARWIVDHDNPLTARVTVNRVWQKYFGRGFVDTENDFGTQGDRPTHPELLDWLAVEFMDRGWSQKALHRLIVTSAVYRQSSQVRPELAAADPENRLLARQNRLRLDAEIIRDESLAASGLLSEKVGGPSVFPPQPAGVYQVTQVRREWKTSTGDDRYRRGLYTFFQRSAPHPSLVVFDAPDATVACTRRVRSNTPLQALTQLNDSGSAELAAALAKRIAAETPDDDTVRLRQGFLYALCREPHADETARLLRFIKVQRDSRKYPWPAVARVLLNLDEFLTRP